jgi:hypothetical protein
MLRYLAILSLLLCMGLDMMAQPDSLVFKNGNYIVGEVKSLSRNTLKVETDYSDDDFTIEWDGVKEIYTKTLFLITLTNGNRYNGSINSNEQGGVTLTTDEGGMLEVTTDQIVYLDGIDQGFWSQIYAGIDIGYDLTKSQNLRSFSMRSNIGYIAKRWQLDGTFNRMTSKQDEVEDIERTDGKISFKYFLPNDWYPTASVDLLSNTEQQLELRSSGRLGFGKYFINSNQLYWGFSVGANFNNENYTPPDLEDRSSWEGFVGTELNLFNIGDLNLLTNVVAYPSFTESGRWRTDFKFDAKYDLPLDFYIKAGFDLNFDNQPAEGSPTVDYVLHTGVGWEW